MNKENLVYILPEIAEATTQKLLHGKLTTPYKKKFTKFREKASSV